MKVLVVEDEMVVSMDIESYLLAMGHTVVAMVDNYDDAVLEIEKNDIDIVLLDINIRGSKTGIDLAKTINESINVPFIFITAFSDEETFKKIKAVKAHGYIVKPFSKREVYSAIELAIVKFNSEQLLKDENKRMEALVEERVKELKESERKYRSIFESLIDVFFRVNADGLITEVSPSVQNVIGYEPSFYIGKMFFKKFNLTEKGKDIIESLKVDGGLSNIPIKLMHKKGHEVQFEINVNVNQDSSGEIVYVEGVARDVTERNKAEEQMKESIRETAQVRDALDQSSIVAITDLDGQIISANEKMVNVSEYTKEEIIGKNHRVLNSNYHSKEFFEELWNTIRKGKVWQNEIRNKSKTGNIYWMDTTIVPTLDEQGKPFQYVVIRNDITSRKEAEEKLKGLLVEKDFLLKEVHHRVKNNLQIISALLSLSESDSPEVQKFIQESNARIKSMALLHENMYQLDDLSKFSFKDYLSYLMTYLFDSFGGQLRGISYHVFVDDLTRLKLKDAITLGLIITEIVTNSLKYAFIGRNQGHIEVSFEDGGGLMKLRIKDNGVGLGENIKSSDSMGMLIIESLVKQLKGSIEIIDDDGVEFFIVFKYNTVND